MKNKFHTKILLAASLLIGASSCEVTDLLPANIIPDSEAFASAERTESAVLGVYEAAQRGFYDNSVQRGYPFGAASFQQGDMRGEDMYNDQAFYEITYTNAYNATTANNVWMWNSLYRVINRANIVMEALDPALSEGVLTQEERNQYRGEMLFIRALSHHELLIHFARPYSDDPSSMGVPYRLFAVNDVGRVPEAEAVSRGTVGEDYAQLIADLDEAEQLMGSSDEVFRATKGAAIALKARIKLHMEDWQGVIDEHAKLAGTYAVTSSVSAPFTSGETTDNVFSFQNSAQANGTVNGALASMYGNPDNGARGLVKISPIIWRASFWHPEDARRGLTSSNDLGIFTDKYTDAVTYSDPTPTIRFAEVVLAAAEANARLGRLEEGLALLNSIRDRAVPASASFKLADFANAEALVTAVLNERRVELLAEGKRWSDIHRLSGEGRMAGVPAKATSRSITGIEFYAEGKAIPLSDPLPYADYKFVWPIPLTEIQNNFSSPLTQNPGWD